MFVRSMLPMCKLMESLLPVKKLSLVYKCYIRAREDSNAAFTSFAKVFPFRFNLLSRSELRH